MNSSAFGLLLTLVMLAPLLIPLLLACFWVNYQSILVLRRERRSSGPSTVRRGSKKLFIIYPSNKE